LAGEFRWRGSSKLSFGVSSSIVPTESIFTMSPLPTKPSRGYNRVTWRVEPVQGRQAWDARVPPKEHKPCHHSFPRGDRSTQNINTQTISCRARHPANRFRGSEWLGRAGQYHLRALVNYLTGLMTSANIREESLLQGGRDHESNEVA